MREITWNWVGREGKNTTECRLRNSGVKRLSDIGYGEKGHALEVNVNGFRTPVCESRIFLKQGIIREVKDCWEMSESGRILDKDGGDCRYESRNRISE